MPSRRMCSCRKVAELDEGRLVESLKKYNGTEVQVIVSTCHAPEEIPGEWKAVRL